MELTGLAGRTCHSREGRCKGSSSRYSGHPDADILLPESESDRRRSPGGKRGFGGHTPGETTPPKRHVTTGQPTRNAPHDNQTFAEMSQAELMQKIFAQMMAMHQKMLSKQDIDGMEERMTSKFPNEV